MKLKIKQNAVTTAYLEGTLIFPDVSDAFLFCRCSDYEFPHDPHWNELARFNYERTQSNTMGRLSKLARQARELRKKFPSYTREYEKVQEESDQIPLPLPPLPKLSKDRKAELKAELRENKSEGDLLITTEVVNLLPEETQFDASNRKRKNKKRSTEKVSAAVEAFTSPNLKASRKSSGRIFGNRKPLKGRKGQKGTVMHGSNHSHLPDPGEGPEAA